MNTRSNSARARAFKRFALAMLMTLASALAVQTAGQAQELVTDGGFENDFGTTFNPPWIQLGDVTSSFPVCGTSSVFPPAPEGQCMGVFGPTDPGTIAQSVNTIAGALYRVSFILGSDGATPNAFSATFGGLPIFSLIDVPAPFVTHEFAVAATAATSDLAFTFQDRAGFIFLDAASVTQIPEPSVVALIAIALAGLALLRRRRS